MNWKCEWRKKFIHDFIIRCYLKRLFCCCVLHFMKKFFSTPLGYFHSSTETISSCRTNNNNKILEYCFEISIVHSWKYGFGGKMWKNRKIWYKKCIDIGDFWCIESMKPGMNSEVHWTNENFNEFTVCIVWRKQKWKQPDQSFWISFYVSI